MLNIGATIPERLVGVVHRVHAAVRGVGGRDRPQRRVRRGRTGPPCPPGSARTRTCPAAAWPAVAECSPRHGHATSPADQEHPHRREDGPALLACCRPSGRTCRSAPPGSAGCRSARCSCRSGVPPSNGWAEFTLKKPPPLVPSCLIAIWTGDRAARDGLLRSPGCRGRSRSAPRGLHDALGHQHDGDEHATAAGGCRATRAHQVDPEVAELVRAWTGRSPRISATSTAMPTAADTKFWKSARSIWVR